jgi:hypothetical protein
MALIIDTYVTALCADLTWFSRKRPSLPPALQWIRDSAFPDSGRSENQHLHHISIVSMLHVSWLKIGLGFDEILAVHRRRRRYRVLRHNHSTTATKHVGRNALMIGGCGCGWCPTVL